MVPNALYQPVPSGFLYFFFVDLMYFQLFIRAFFCRLCCYCIIWFKFYIMDFFCTRFLTLIVLNIVLFNFFFCLLYRIWSDILNNLICIMKLVFFYFFFENWKFVFFIKNFNIQQKNHHKIKTKVKNENFITNNENNKKKFVKIRLL